MLDLSNRKLLLLLAFIEGASVMAVELLGAKMIAPFFGSSLYVWAAVLGVTLFALMLGYYLGGYVSEKSKKENSILWVLLIGSIFIAIMPYSSNWIMKETIDSSIQVGATISLCIFLLPPLILMGMTSPLIINKLNNAVDQSGKTAGLVYATSTFGGILGTFLTGFYLLPEFGIKWPCIIFAVLLAVFPVLILMRKSMFKTTLCLIPLIGASVANLSANESDNSRIKLIYESEGIFGELKVYDMPYYTISRGVKNGRLMMVNNTAQTIHDVDNPTRDLWDYSYYFPTAASVYPAKSDMLLMGLGGGSLVHHFNRLDYNLDVVELDERVKDVAIEYFNVDPKTNVIVDDARHYLNTCKKKYDIIVMDLFLNETPPAHVLTLESFSKAKQLLKKDGMIMINFYGYISGDKGLAARSIYKTLKKAGFQVEILPTPGEEEHRNLLFLASENLKSFEQTNYDLPDLPKLTRIDQQFIPKQTFISKDARLLTDSKPELESMYLEAALDWRSVSIEYNLKKLIENGFY